MTEHEKMLAGALYNASDPEFVAHRLRTRTLTHRFTHSLPGELNLRRKTIRVLFESIGIRFEIKPDFRCDYGSHFHAGEDRYMNFSCVILDVCPVTIGRQVFFAPGVHL
jgi:maltose O-acetyltransferase